MTGKRMFSATTGGICGKSITRVKNDAIGSYVRLISLSCNNLMRCGGRSSFACFGSRWETFRRAPYFLFEHNKRGYPYAFVY